MDSRHATGTARTALRRDGGPRWSAPSLIAASTLPLLVAAALVLAFTLVANGGRFIYTLDDPYIHLALSERIAQGHYGINRGEFSSPSSSILFPFLLAIGAGTPLHVYIPLAVNLASLFALTALLISVCERCGLLIDREHCRFMAALVALACLMFNAVGLAFTGMEHSLHVVATVATAAGVIAVAQRRPPAWWFYAAAMAGPLLRYEGLAVSGAALVVMALAGLRRQALWLGAVIAGGVGAFSWFLVAKGLPPLPSSVLMKSKLMALGADHGLLAVLSAAGGIDPLAISRPGLILFMLAAIAAAVVARARPLARSPESLVGLFLVLVLALHLVAGKNGWFHRYEIYALFAAVACFLFLYRAPLSGPLTPRLGLWVCLIAGSLGLPYLRGTGHAVGAANNIYEQQYQMHRFVSEFYKKPVAVNDLGWVAYRNDQYVFDLWGLGSEEARAFHKDLPRRAEFRGQVEALIQARGIALAIVYEARFKDLIPASWQPVARLHLGRPKVSAAEPTVTFFATDAAAEQDIACRLEAFARTLPPSVRFDQALPCPTAG